VVPPPELRGSISFTQLSVGCVKLFLFCEIALALMRNTKGAADRSRGGRQDQEGEANRDCKELGHPSTLVEPSVATRKSYDHCPYSVGSIERS
jgi:hypothetical protein